MEASSDCSDSEDSGPGIDFESNKKVLNEYLKFVGDRITKFSTKKLIALPSVMNG